jgi:hypothetical protein
LLKKEWRAVIDKFILYENEPATISDVKWWAVSEASLSLTATYRLMGMGVGVGILYRNAIASRVAKGNLRIINVPELKELGIS